MQMEIFEDMQTTGCEGCWMGMWHRMGGGHEQGFETVKEGFPGGSVLKNPPASVGDFSSFPGLGRFYMLGATKSVRHNS